MQLVISYLFFTIIFTSCIQVSHKLPDAAGVIDVTKSPFNADNTGKTDCSEALQKAFTYAVNRTKGIYTDKERALQILYFPNGTYKVSKPLVFVSKEIKEERDKNSISLKKYISGHTMIYGESKENTKIFLEDNSADFQKNPTPLIRFLESNFTNTAYFNGIRNITIEVGKNNPQAVAVEFVSSNIGSINNVAIINKDENYPAEIALNLPIRAGGLAYISNLTIYGFKTGIFVKGDFPGYTFENISLENQKEAGIKNVAKNIVIHNLKSKNKVPAIITEGEGAITTVLDGQLTGGSQEYAAIIGEGHLLLRNIEIEGYKEVLNEKNLKLNDNTLKEYASSTLGLFDNAPETTLNLPIKPTPDYPFPKASKWTIFNVSEQDDDTEALQKLIDSGAEYIFVNGVEEKIKLSGTIYLRGALKILHGGWTNMDIENKGEFGAPLFRFEDGENELMILEGFSNGQFRNTFCTFFNARNQTLVIRDVFMGYGDVAYRNSGSGDLFLENVVTGGGDYPEQAEHKVAGWKIENQNVWFRNLNPEDWVPDLHIGKGSKVFGIGAKFGELYGTHLLVTEGGQAELYGVMCNVNMKAPHFFGLDVHGPSMTGITVEVENADVSLGTFQDGEHNDPDPIFIREIQGNDTILLSHKDAPLRSKGKQSVATPLYRSRFSDK